MVASGTTLHTSYPSTNSFVRFEFEKAKLRIQIVDAKVRGTFKSRESLREVSFVKNLNH